MQMLFTNNSRKLHGLPLHRKKDQRKRNWTRCEADETIEAFLDFCRDHRTELRSIEKQKKRECGNLMVGL